MHPMISRCDDWLLQDDQDDGLQNVTLFQSKHRDARYVDGCKDVKLAAFLNAPDRILSVAQVAQAKNEETKELHDHIVKLAKSSDQRCTLNLAWVTSGTLTPKAKQVADENSRKALTKDIGGNPREFNVAMKCWDLHDLHENYKMQLETDDPAKAPCDVEFELEPDLVS